MSNLLTTWITNLLTTWILENLHSFLITKPLCPKECRLPLPTTIGNYSKVSKIKYPFLVVFSCLQQKARDELELLSAKSNSIKTELREFYQNQLNSNVKEKLKEFQSQLDSAELSLHREFQAKEKTIAENAAKQLKQISEKLVDIAVYWPLSFFSNLLTRLKLCLKHVVRVGSSTLIFKRSKEKYN